MTCDLPQEELARFSTGELGPDAARHVADHVAACQACRRALAALRALDATLGELPRIEPPTDALLRARRRLSQEVRRTPAPELMTLDEVAAFLRLSLDELEEIVLELPAFELAGQVRVRRARLIEWIEARERAWTRSSAQAEVARALSDAV